MKRKRKTGSILKVQMLKNMYKYIFMQDGAPAHTASKTQQWCSDHLEGFWEKTEWPGNSADLNPIENLCSTGWPNEIETNILSLKQPTNLVRSFDFLVTINISTILAIELRTL